MREYKPYNAETQSWDNLENHFRNNLGGEYWMLADLIQYIKNSPLANRLYGSTRMLETLVISIYNPIDFQKEALHISFNPANNTWLFEYQALPFQDPEFVRTYEADKAIEKLEQFIKFLNW